MTIRRAALCQWINDTLAADHAGDAARGDAARYRRTLRIVEETAPTGPLAAKTVTLHVG